MTININPATTIASRPLKTFLRFGRIIPAGDDPDFLEVEAGSGQFNWQVRDSSGKCQNYIADTEDALALLGMAQTKTETMFQLMAKFVKARIGDKAEKLNPYTSGIHGYQAKTPYKSISNRGLMYAGDDPGYADRQALHNQAVVALKENDSQKVFNFIAQGWDAVALAGLCENMENSNEIAQIVFDYLKERLDSHSKELDAFKKWALFPCKMVFRGINDSN